MSLPGPLKSLSPISMILGGSKQKSPQTQPQQSPFNPAWGLGWGSGGGLPSFGMDYQQGGMPTTGGMPQRPLPTPMGSSQAHSTGMPANPFRYAAFGGQGPNHLATFLSNNRSFMPQQFFSGTNVNPRYKSYLGG